ncbi:LLM class flavin-dependent oxidoreductase [Frankia sp. AgPm24]|uniref:LLM class flavin-dependent oxidoreductase n=1 Tax=Frankia umida TaxID=573489 RepID=A0ABT0K3H9_9ACTN|nr:MULTISPECIES: LLM class flavin-dependent oxidoreductase [Frankia]MCK9878052.1 LLM class flavin-dependent oxidoreductase [Frankia umida]MCK9922414.1 LLM class flavin-dependent oxidoreductase [Frankia sp. AgPm24]
MRVGLGYLNMAPAGDSATARALYADFLHDVRWAEDRGFAGIWVTEHHFSTYSLTSSPLILLAQAAAAAPRLRLGTSILVLPFWDPVRLAADVLTLDALSAGRFDFGIGRGYQPHEFLGFGRDAADNREIFAEAVDALEQLFTQEDRDFKGRHVRIDAPVTLLPRPTQQPHPPIWMAATSPESLRFAADRGFHFMLPAVTTYDQIVERRGWIDQAGGLPAGREFQVNRFVYLGDDAGRQRVVREIARQLQTSAALTNSVYPDAGAAPTPDQIDPAVEEKVRDILITGSADEVIDQFRALADVGISYVIAGFEFGYLNTETARHSRERFANEVLPHLADLTPSRPGSN